MKVALLLSLFLLSACGVHQIVIPNIDMAMTSKLKNQFDLYVKQEDQAATDVDALLNKIRPLVDKKYKNIAKYINPITTEIEKPDMFFNEFIALYAELGMEINHILAKYLSLLNEKQFNHFVKVTKKEIKDIKKRTKNYDPKLIYKRLDFFLGEINKKQKELIQDNLSYFESSNQRRFKARTRLLDSMINLNKHGKKNYLKELNHYHQETIAYMKSAESKKRYQLFIDFLKLNNKKQIKSLQKRLKQINTWIKYFTKHEY